MADAATIPSSDEQPLAGGSFSPLDALVGVVVRPRITFERMREAARGHWWLVFVLAFAALVLVTLASVPIQAEMTQAMLREQLAEMPAEQQAQIEQTQAIFTSQAMLGAVNTATGTVGIVVSYALRALVLFLLCLALGGRASFVQVWRMAVWTALPDVARNLVAAVTIFATGGLPARGLTFIFTGQEQAALSPIVAALLRSLDIYTVWGLALVAIGVIATSRFSRVKGIAVAVIFWLLSLGASAGWAAAGQALGRAFGAG